MVSPAKHPSLRAPVVQLARTLQPQHQSARRVWQVISSALSAVASSVAIYLSIYLPIYLSHLLFSLSGLSLLLSHQAVLSSSFFLFAEDHLQLPCSQSFFFLPFLARFLDFFVTALFDLSTILTIYFGSLYIIFL